MFVSKLCTNNGVFLYKCVMLLFVKSLVMMVGQVFKNLTLKAVNSEY